MTERNAEEHFPSSSVRFYSQTCARSEMTSERLAHPQTKLPVQAATVANQPVKGAWTSGAVDAKQLCTRAAQEPHY